MAYTNKGQASEKSNFFHITFHTDDKRWYAVDVHEGKRNSFSSQEEAWKQIEKWARESGADKSSHVYIHDEHNRIREERTI